MLGPLRATGLNQSKSTPIFRSPCPGLRQRNSSRCLDDACLTPSDLILSPNATKSLLKKPVIG